jgi:GT2 family glycosyltransferase
MISIIICSINPRKFEKICKCYAALMGDEPYEVIGIHDAKSLSEGYNRAIKASSGSLLIFSHDDVEILSPDFIIKLKKHLQQVDIVGPAGTSKIIDGYWPRAGTPYIHGQVGYPEKDQPLYTVALYDLGQPAQEYRTLTTGIEALDGMFFAVNRKVVDQLSFDEKTFDAFHGYDVDFTYTAFLAGFRLGVCNDIAIIHDSDGQFDETWERYNERFIEKYSGTLPDPRSLQLSGERWMIVQCREKSELACSFELATQRALGAELIAMRKKKETPPPASTSLIARCLMLLVSGLFKR